MTMDGDSSISSSESTNMAQEPSIWNTGTVSEAIQLSLTQQKLFLVWISPSSTSSTLDDSWSQVWTNSQIKSTLLEHAVSIKLEQGTTDAAMFLQFVAMDGNAVGIWIIFAGQLGDSLSQPEDPEEMVRRIQTAIS